MIIWDGSENFQCLTTRVVDRFHKGENKNIEYYHHFYQALPLNYRCEITLRPSKNECKVAEKRVMIWHNANIKTIKLESIAIRIERRFASSGIPDDLARQTSTGERRNTSEVAPELAEERAVTRGSEKAEEEDAKVATGPRKWAGSRKRKGETKKSIKAKQLLPTLFDIGLGDTYQDQEALAYLRDARTERKLLLPMKKGISRDDVEQEADEGMIEEGEEEVNCTQEMDNPFQTIGK